ncbi:diguanylate cyclase domain-containing protein [Sphingomonas sp. R86521]|uniref:GGDEF domain-containing protein n=1 Tax=Sphingomonas sp. R86521 TaxID=3093860 RepID=UPI0036D2DF6B
MRLAAMAMLAVAFALSASPAVARTPITVCIAPSSAGDAPRALFAHPERFDCTTSQNRLGSGDFWAMSQPLPNDTAMHGLNAGMASLWQDAVTLYVLYADGHIARTGFTSANAGHHLRLGATLALSVPAYDARPVRLLWHVEGAANMRGILLGASLASDAEQTESDMVLAVLYGAFAGMAIALIIYNLALWGALRQSFQPAYCVLLLCLLGYAISSSGALGRWLPDFDNNDRLRVNAVLLAASAMAAVVFARAFFEQRVFHGWLGRAADMVIVGLATTTMVYVTFAPTRIVLLDHVVLLTYLLLPMLVIAVLVRAWRQHSTYLWLFALAWGAPIAFASLRIASAANLIPWNFWLDQSTTISMMFEALLSSVAIAYRIRLLSRERDEARVQESAARLLADTDPLTGLLNRRSFLAGAIGRNGDQALLIIDIDHFKAVNETIGHDGGDEVLRVVARALRLAAPVDALVARIGGEEFAIVAHESSRLAPETILAALRRARMPYDIAVTASIGTCIGPMLREADWKRLYCDADRALFAAKAGGRDRVRDAHSLAA